MWGCETSPQHARCCWNVQHNSAVWTLLHSIYQQEGFCAQLCALKQFSLGLFYTKADSIPQQPISWQSTSSYCVLLVRAAMVQLRETLLHTELPTSSLSSPYIHSPKWSLEAPEGLQGWRNCRFVVDGSVLLSFSALRWQHLGLGLLFWSGNSIAFWATLNVDTMQ